MARTCLRPGVMLVHVEQLREANQDEYPKTSHRLLGHKGDVRHKTKGNRGAYLTRDDLSVEG